MRLTLSLIGFLALFCVPAFAQKSPVLVSTNTAFAQGDLLVWSDTAWVPVNKGTDGQSLTMSGTNLVWATSSGSGTMTGITLTNAATTPFTFSPNSTTTSNTFTLSPATQSANTVYAGPTSGGAATPTFRAIVDDDVPDTITIDLAAVATVANSGDSATSFFTTGTIEDARIDSAIARDAEVASLYQPLDADLTALAAGTAIPTAITNAVSLGAPTQYVGTTNIAAELALKAPLASPALTGDPTVPTASPGDSDTSAASTAFVQANANLVHTNVIYVSKAGNDSNSGRTVNLPKLTIGSAITAAAAMAPATIHVIDGGAYTESITLTANLHLFAPGATLNGELAIDSSAEAVLDKVVATAPNQNLISLSSAVDGPGIVKVNIVDGRAFNGVNLVRNVGGGGKNLFIEIGIAYIGTNGIGVGDVSAGNGHIHIRIPDIYLAGDNAIGINGANNGANAANIVGWFDHIIELSSLAPTNTIGISVSHADARVKVAGNEIIADATYNISAGSLYLICSKVTGARTGTPIYESSDAALLGVTNVVVGTSVTIGGTNVLDYAATHLTEAEASALYQGTNANLTTVSALTSGTSTNFFAGDGSFKQVTTNMVPGLNAILATIGGGSGEVNTATNLGTQSATVQGLFDNKTGVELQFRSIEAGTGITLTSNSTTVTIESTGGSAADVQVFTNSGTWTKPSGKTVAYVFVMGAGGGGGAGRRGAAATLRCGGGSGGSGGVSEWTGPLSVLGSTETVTVGSGGSGGAAATVDNSNGNNGAAGTNSTFGTQLWAGGGTGGNGGTAVSGSAGVGGGGRISGYNGIGSAVTGGGGYAGISGNIGIAASAGGSAGGITSADAVSSGGAGGEGPRMWRGTSQLVGGTGGSSGGNGGAGNTAGLDLYIGGTGGGGGASSILAAAGSGGNGGAYGASGGGGGASLNGNNSGAGGSGANGIIVVISY